MHITNETKAILHTEGTGRVIGFVKSSEPGKISIAVPNDRAVMIPAQARQLAAWLNEEADRAERVSTNARTDAGWRAREAERQAAIREALDTDRVTFRGRTYVRRGEFGPNGPMSRRRRARRRHSEGQRRPLSGSTHGFARTQCFAVRTVGPKGSRRMTC
ncbi:gp15 [Streptomyces phage phiBT1]|uniref:Gp15 n=1 Tax=Lomovskayavirus BT1 TaxID=225588 RepID=Q858Y7_9CAUD|nr:gp15 [Streptomyces phage phiBT1]CAD80138.1 gp15 [Lomovskayavirus BT1]